MPDAVERASLLARAAELELWAAELRYAARGDQSGHELLRAALREAVTSASVARFRLLVAIAERDKRHTPQEGA